MAISKTKQFKKFDVDMENKTISIMYQIVVTDSVEGELARKDFRQAFVPGQVEAVKTFTGAGNTHPAIVFLNSIWTQAVIDAYNTQQAAQQP